MRRSVRYVKLKHLSQSGFFASGNARYYYRPKDQKGIAMPDAPKDDPRFLAAYAKAAGETPRAPVVRGSIASAMALYKASEDFAHLSTGTRAARRPMLDEVAQMYGFGRVKGLQQKHIQKDLERFSGHAHNNHLKMWRGFCKWMQYQYKLESDPSDGIKRAKTAKSDGHIPWDTDQIEQFRAYWPIGTMERLAFELIFWTGARVSDAIRLGEGHIDKDGWLAFHQQKTGGEVNIPFNRELPECAEPFENDLALLHQAINARNERHVTFIITNFGTSRSAKSVSQWFAAKARKAGIKGRTAHGLRKSRAIALAETGGTSPQIGAWTGHESLKEIERYIKKFNKRKALTKTETEQKVPTSSNQFQKLANNTGKTNA
jgi:integrase